MRSPFPLGRRGLALLGAVFLAICAYDALDLSPGLLLPREGGAHVAREFFSAALRPALDYESGRSTGSGTPFLSRVVEASQRTLVFAAASMSLALVVGLLLGFLASSRWWAGDPLGSQAGGRRRRHRIGPALQVTTRLVIALMRSVHELLWALILLAAFGLNTAAAVIALAIPFSGVLAKVFSELLDEAPDEAARALRAAGATPIQAFLAGTFSRALPDMAAYSLYRFECAVRSSAILGFFGYETLGYHLRLSFESLKYREVWTYLYALLFLVLCLEAWSAALRRRVVA